METKSKENIRPNILSDVLLSEYVLKREENERFNIDKRWNASDSFYEHVILFKLAVVIMALLKNEQDDIGFYQVRLEFEKAIFSDGNVQKLYFYYEVKSAMDKIGELINPKNKGLDNLRDQNNKMPWTMACLRDNGVLGSDQAILHSRGFIIGMGWAMAWLRELGILETNPMILSRFAIMWMDNYITVNDILKGFNPLIQW